MDEIGDMPPSMQVKLLRVLETGEFERVGEERTIKVDVRVIAATNKRLEDEVRSGRFREDLFYRLNVFTIEVSPLRERSEDILPLSYHFLKISSRELGKEVKGFTPEAEKLLLTYHWPGNVRELKHAIERAVITSKSPYIGVYDMPPHIHRSQETFSNTISLRIGLKMKDIEREVIKRTLIYTGGNKKKAAEVLGIGLATLYRKLRG